MADSFPLRKALTRGFRLGAPRTVSISPDGTELLYLRSDGPTDPVNHLWLARFEGSSWVEHRLADASVLLAGAEDLPPEEKARRERLREVSAGITGYSVADDWSRVAFALSGTLHTVATDPGAAVTVTDVAGCADPIISPDGSQVAVTVGRSVVVSDSTGGHAVTVLEPAVDEEFLSYGSAEFIAAEEMGRFHGMWWSPDGDQLLVAAVDESPVPRWWIGDPATPDASPRDMRYPAAGASNAVVDLIVVDLDGTRHDVSWPRDDFEYVARARWDDHGILVMFQDRSQTRTRTVRWNGGDARVIAEAHDPRWVELLPGLPRLTAFGAASSVVDDDVDTRRLVVSDGTTDRTIQTPPGLQVRAALSDDDSGVVFLGSQGDPSTCDLWRLTPSGETVRLSDPGGWSSGVARGGTTLVARADLDTTGSTVTVLRGQTSWRVPSLAEAPALDIRPEVLDDGTGWGRTTILWPTAGSDRGPLPVIMSPYGGPHAQRSLRAAGSFTTEQWLADHGFCVIVADGPGAPPRPSNEFALAGDLAGPPLQGQVDALAAVAERYPDRLDLSRVGIRGWSFGGYLAALAVLRRPDVFHAAVAGAPVSEWRLYDTHYTERYLGMPQDEDGVYDASSLLPLAAHASPHRPLLLIHGLADDNVVAAHTLRLSSALLSAGYPHTVLPLSGVTHMTPQEVVAENLLLLELDFLTANLTRRVTSAPL